MKWNKYFKAAVLKLVVAALLILISLYLICFLKLELILKMFRVIRKFGFKKMLSL